MCASRLRSVKVKDMVAKNTCSLQVSSEDITWHQCEWGALYF